jgi:hypothetical protein
MDVMDAAATIETRREQEQQERRSDRSLEALKYVNEHGEAITTLQLAQHLSSVGAKVSTKVAGNLLARLHAAGLIEHPVRGLYERKK